MSMQSMCVVICLCLTLGGGMGTFVDDEESLRADLLANYSIKVRPYLKTNINISATIIALNGLDIAGQTMSMMVILNFYWFDYRLVWNEASYGGLTSFVAPPEDVWTPPIVIENAAADVGALGGKGRDDTPLRILSNGIVDWFPVQETTTTCEMSIANYPFDTQKCSIVLVGWTYPLSEVSFNTGYSTASSLYTPNGEFDLIHQATSSMDIGELSSENTTFRRIIFEYTFRRKWQFYGQNLLMPIVLNSILMNAVFLLPIESGGKMGYSLTVLLSYIVFLTWVTENLPSVSTDTSILQVYLAVVLCLGCLACLLTNWVLNLHHTPAEKPMNGCLQKFASSVLVHFSTVIPCRKRKKENTDDVGNDVLKMTSSKIRPVSSPRPASPNFSTDRCFNDTNKDDMKEDNGDGAKEADPKTTSSKVTFISSRLASLECSFNQWLSGTKREAPNDGPYDDDFVKASEHDQEREVTRVFSWQELAVLFDSFFMFVFALILFTVTVVIFALLYANY